MTRVLRMTGIAVAAAFVAGAVTTEPQRALAQTPRPTAAPVLVLLGCVERVAPATPASNPTAPVVPTFKIMDVQPGGTGQKPTTLATEYLVVGPETIQFSKFQNQWVEVTGSITAATSAPPPPARGQRGSALSTFTVTALKVVANECKGIK
jgi:hypothetical protein